MRHDIAMRWVEALRSGKYKQGFGRLVDYDRDYPMAEKDALLPLCHCVMGVLYDITAVERHERLYRGTERPRYIPTDNSMGTSLSTYAGIKSGRVLRRDRMYSIIDLNDHIGLSFSQLADLIEEQWEKL